MYLFSPQSNGGIVDVLAPCPTISVSTVRLLYRKISKNWDGLTIRRNRCFFLFRWVLDNCIGFHAHFDAALYLICNSSTFLWSVVLRIHCQAIPILRDFTGMLRLCYQSRHKALVIHNKKKLPRASIFS